MIEGIKLLMECIGLKQNLHKSQHAKACFKRDCECRMKLLQPPQKWAKVLFNDKETNWFLWNGDNKKKNLFYVAQKRGIADCFANMHNRDVTDLNYSNATTAWSQVWMGVVPCMCHATHRKTPKMKTAKKMIKRMNKERREQKQKK
jgi:hypothetical protein